LAERIQLGVSYLIRLVLGIAIIEGVLTGNWGAVFVSSLALVLTVVPLMLVNRYKIVVPVSFELLVVLFIYASVFLGGVRDYYLRFWWWDVALHTGSGFALGFIGFLILYVLYLQEKFKASPFLIAVMSWAFALALGALWEIFEYAMDLLLGVNMQKSGLPDTMGDLIVDCVGALFAAGVGYVYMRYEVWDPFDKAIWGFLKTNPRLKKTVSKKNSTA
jgi:hypothetical protein